MVEECKLITVTKTDAETTTDTIIKVGIIAVGAYVGALALGIIET